MDGLWKYFEKHDAIFTALIALTVGLIAYLGAKAQANGGRAQAAAAREAATIAAEAQRVANLWTVRQVQIAQLVRSASSLRQTCNRLWIVNDEDLADEINVKSEELSVLWSEVRLIATQDVVEEAGRLAANTMKFEELTHQFAPVLHAKAKLYRYFPDGTREGDRAMHVMHMSEDVDPEQRAEMLSAAVGSVLSHEEIYHLVAHGRKTDREISDLRDRQRQRCLVAEDSLVHETRAMLRSKEDIEPEASTRRRWRRRR
ncbi:hypothetical protein [Streptomyces hydrogenans]|uniref:Secreted protein n=1 Tax=Streptomyces hydrogenans TaxID=1873719 RepID=A0ABQ3PJH9_9ACTN|nr:hypothetical protein [Streptomyces hydrogenans]GHG10201.1 hypothetical protein GCM10018784_23640 [Streptomyces hydrogenans]GHI25184.1 hypothetical protein Shyd_65550 [Streptomyces hydrogenans]